MELKKDADEAVVYANRAVEESNTDEATLLLWAKMMLNSSQEKTQ